MNSSPPCRLTVSERRTDASSRPATDRSSSSPIAWPQTSLICLKWSTSRNRTASRWPLRFAAAIALASRSSRRARFGRSVSGSWSASCCRSSWCRAADSHALHLGAGKGEEQKGQKQACPERGLAGLQCDIGSRRQPNDDLPRLSGDLYRLGRLVAKEATPGRRGIVHRAGIRPFVVVNLEGHRLVCRRDDVQHVVHVDRAQHEPGQRAPALCHRRHASATLKDRDEKQQRRPGRIARGRRERHASSQYGLARVAGALERGPRHSISRQIEADAVAIPGVARLEEHHGITVRS